MIAQIDLVPINLWLSTAPMLQQAPPGQRQNAHTYIAGSDVVFNSSSHHWRVPFCRKMMMASKSRNKVIKNDFYRFSSSSAVKVQGFARKRPNFCAWTSTCFLFPIPLTAKLRVSLNKKPLKFIILLSNNKCDQSYSTQLLSVFPWFIVRICFYGSISNKLLHRHIVELLSITTAAITLVVNTTTEDTSTAPLFLTLEDTSKWKYNKWKFFFAATIAITSSRNDEYAAGKEARSSVLIEGCDNSVSQAVTRED